MDLRTHAVREMNLVGLKDGDPDFDRVLSLIDLLVKQAPDNWLSTVNLFYQLTNAQTLSPLTGSDDEWDQVSPILWMNNRCPHVFKELGVGTYDAHAVIFIDEEDRMFTKQPQSRKIVSFPYVPQSQYVKVRTKQKIILPYGSTRPQ